VRALEFEIQTNVTFYSFVRATPLMAFARDDLVDLAPRQRRTAVPFVRWQVANCRGIIRVVGAIQLGRDTSFIRLDAVPAPEVTDIGNDVVVETRSSRDIRELAVTRP